MSPRDEYEWPLPPAFLKVPTVLYSTTSPLRTYYFVRSGYVNLPGRNNNTLLEVNIDGNYWSLYGAAYTSSTLAGAYGFYFGATAVLPSHGPGHRYYGFPLRCLSTVIDI